jgi:ankyrin repeat protein
MQSQSGANAAFFYLMHLERDDQADLVMELLEQNRMHLPGTVQIDINSRDRGVSALRLAISDSNVQLVQILLYYGADCNLVTTDEENKEPLLHCAMRSHRGGITMMRLLLDMGASACEITSDGTTSLHLACASGVIDKEERLMLLLDKIPLIELPRLLSSRAGRTEKTPLLKVTNIIISNYMSTSNTNYVSNINIFKLLVGLGSDLEVRDHNGRTVMSMCIRYMHTNPRAPGPDILKLLLEHGAKTETVVNDRGWTALHEAVVGRKVWAVEMLLNAGANAHALTDNGTSPLGIAQRQYGSPQVLECFRSLRPNDT